MTNGESLRSTYFSSLQREKRKVDGTSGFLVIDPTYTIPRMCGSSWKRHRFPNYLDCYIEILHPGRLPSDSRDSGIGYRRKANRHCSHPWHTFAYEQGCRLPLLLLRVELISSLPLPQNSRILRRLGNSIGKGMRKIRGKKRVFGMGDVEQNKSLDNKRQGEDAS